MSVSWTHRLSATRVASGPSGTSRLSASEWARSVLRTMVRYPCSAAGHWRFGESAEQAAREIDEELGLRVAFASLRFVGREREDRAFANGLIDREFHQVYALDWDAPLTSYRPDPREVSALAAVSSAGLLELVGGRL